MNNYELMIRLLATVSVKGKGEIFFTKKIRTRVRNIGDAIRDLESQFLDKRALRVNDEVWEELSFEFIEQKCMVDKLSTRYECMLNELLKQINEVSDMRTGSKVDDDS